MLRTGERGYESNGKKRTKTEESVDNERKSFAHLLKPTIGKHITPLSPLLLSPPSLYLAPYLILSLCLFTFLSLIHRFFKIFHSLFCSSVLSSSSVQALLI